MRKPSNCNGTVDFLDAHTLFSKRVKENYDFEI